MSISITEYLPAHEGLVAEFNQRLSSSGSQFQFERSSTPPYPKGISGAPLYQEYFLALDEEGVHGGYKLQQQPFWMNGESARVANYQLPLSEGSIDRRYSSLAPLLVRDALKRYPKLFALGMGGIENTLPKFLRLLGWKTVEVPFYFRVVNGRAFLKNIETLRSTKLRKFGLDMAANLGFGRAFPLWHQLGVQVRADSSISVEEFEHFDRWTDGVWEAGKRECSLAAERSSAVLSQLYPASDRRFIRLRFLRGAECIGWVVLLNTPMEKHKQFGAMRVGTIVDCFSISVESAKMLIHGATEILTKRGADLIISNQMHSEWGSGLKLNGYLQGPSNFVFASSPALTRDIGNSTDRIHMNRGDGDGPIHL